MQTSGWRPKEVFTGLAIEYGKVILERELKPWHLIRQSDGRELPSRL
jgi:hypothetical protein